MMQGSEITRQSVIKAVLTPTGHARCETISESIQTAESPPLLKYTVPKSRTLAKGWVEPSGDSVLLQSLKPKKVNYEKIPLASSDMMGRISCSPQGERKKERQRRAGEQR